MDFSDFVQLLYPIIGAGSSTHAFTKSILEAIVTDEGIAALDERGNETYKAYFNGNTKITKLAQNITAYIEPEEFIGYIEPFSDAAVQSLCDSFQPYLPDISLHNVGEKLAELFAAIIKEAASTKKKGTPKGAFKTETIEAEVVDDEEPSGAAEEEKKDKKITVIQHQTNVVQTGENNFNLTNNGTINFNL